MLVGAAAAAPAAAAGWEEQSSGMGESTWLETVCAISTSEAWIGGSPPSVLLHTTDGGAGWNGVGVPITGDLQSMAFIGQAGWVSAHDYGGAGYNYDVHTTDGGQNWVDRPPPLATGTVDRFLPTGPDTCWGWRNLGNAAPKAQLLLTTDGGLTWAGNAAWATGGYIQPSAGSFVSPQSVWFLADSKVYRTTDNGASWSVSDPAAPSYLSYIDFVSATTGWVANGDGYVARTTDTGASWQAVPLPISRQVEAIDFFDAANGWVTTADGTVWHTTNGGTTWGAPAYKTGKILLDVSAAGASDAWISGTQGLILHTSDGGGPADTTPPTATAVGPTNWVGTPANVTITVDDGAGIGAYKAQWKWETDPGWSLGWSPAVVPVTPAGDHSLDGLHTLTYHGIDWAYNVGADQTIDVGIDTVAPTAAAPRAASVRRGRSVTLKYRINDAAPNGGTGAMQIVIKNRAGKVVKRSPILWNKAVNTTLGWKFTCRLKKGTYKFLVTVCDEAGNFALKTASNRLTVR
jgi:photosystem II stability/assembly factor-like uncharacterized protein